MSASERDWTTETLDLFHPLPGEWVWRKAWSRWFAVLDQNEDCTVEVLVDSLGRLHVTPGHFNAPTPVVFAVIQVSMEEP